MNVPTKIHSFVSFDGGISVKAELAQPNRYRFWDEYQFQSSVISRGSGLSYAGASFIDRGLSISHSDFNRIVDFDSSRNIVEVEAGISLQSLHNFLSIRGLYLPVQPGHGQISVGGCVAADVHGKNHYRDGTFISQVVSLTLFHPDYDLLYLSRDHQPELFYLTCGGYGLTGHILKVCLQASVIPSHIVRVQAVKISNLAEGLVQLQESASQVDFIYSWHDFTKKGKSFGSGFLFKASFSNSGATSNFATNPMSAPYLTSKRRAYLPLSLLNHFSTYGLNAMYRLKQRAAIEGMSIPLHKALFPTHQLQAYFSLFGRAGFHEYQVILPLDAMLEYLNEIKKYIDQGSPPITLASAKAFSGSQNLLRFSGRGICFALNFPRTQKSKYFIDFLDKRLVDLGGIPNIIKDSRLPRQILDACYPEVDLFRNLLRSFDSKRLFKSELSERLGL